MSQLLNALVRTIRLEADDVVSLELLPAETGATFPAFEAGAHIDLHLPNGLVRNYSLVNSTEERDRYVIGVLQDRASRGGSRCVHQQVRVGMTLPISAPRNNFRLHEEADRSVLVAGGIGITPILCMLRRLMSIRRPVELLYFARSRRSAAFAAEIEALGASVTWHFDDERGGPPDLHALLGSRPPRGNTHYYACGPGVLLDAFERSCESLGYAHAHIERFAALPVEASQEARVSYVAELRSSGRTFTVTPAKSLLQTLLDAGIDVDHSCQEGVCGTCETAVIAGVPDHRDSVLSANEKASGKVIMVCVSGCKSERLVLDL
jgi:ferredoxin-NADP reductase